jgi:hypothetical protein
MTLGISIEAPARTRNSTKANRPFSAATCRGVIPVLCLGSGELENAFEPVARGQVSCSDDRMVFLRQASSGGQESVDDVLPPVEEGGEQNLLSSLRPVVHVGACGDQPLHGLQIISPVRGQVEGRSPAKFPRHDICPPSKEECDGGCVPFVGGVVERRAALHICGIDVGTPVQKELG